MYMSFYAPNSLQLIASMFGYGGIKVWHGHNLDHKTSPASKVLSTLTLARIRVILLPSETRSLPVVVDILYKVLAQARVSLLRLCLVRPLLLRDVLLFASHN